MPKLPRAIRMDQSDTFVFDRAAEPGEWAVSGAFAFMHDDKASLKGKRRQAFANGFLGVDSLGRSTFVSVASAEAAEVERVVGALARQLVAGFGCPTLDLALPAAREEVAFAAELCEGHPVNTLLAVSRRLDDEGQIRESFRVVEPAHGKDHARIWDIVAEDDGDGADGAPGEQGDRR